MRKSRRHVIWSNYDLDLDDWQDFFDEEYPDSTENERYEMMYEMNDEYLWDERANLNVQLGRPILVIGSLGLWNGTFSGYKEIESGNIKDCLYSDTDYATWYVDSLGDLRCEAVHHDGTNSYLHRVYKEDVTETQIENLKEKIYEGRATREDITRITRRIGTDVAEIYGFAV